MPQHNTTTLSMRALKTACAHCNFHELCQPLGLSVEDVERITHLVSNQKSLKRGDSLYRVGKPFEAFYAIRTGFFKTDVIFEDGRTQVTGFQMEGDILGLDGVGSNVHTCNATALENSEVCIIPYSRIETISKEVHSLQRHLHQVMSREIVQDHHVMLLLGTMRSEERLAAFLINLSKRFSARGFSSSEFHLRMTREEIGSFLGLKFETVSRVFSRFQDEGLIAVQQKHIKITNRPRLESVLSH